MKILLLILYIILFPVLTHATNLCDPVNPTNCEEVNSASTGGGLHTTEYSKQKRYIGQKATYSIESLGIVGLSTSQINPFCVICGSGTRKVIIQNVNIVGSEQVAAARRSFIFRLTTRPTRPVDSTAPTPLDAIPYDSRNGISTVNQLYLFSTATSAFSSEPITSRLVRIVTKIFPITGTVAATNFIPDDNIGFVGTEMGGITLNGVSQCLEISLATIGANAPAISIGLTWTEE